MSGGLKAERIERPNPGASERPLSDSEIARMGSKLFAGLPFVTDNVSVGRLAVVFNLDEERYAMTSRRTHGEEYVKRAEDLQQHYIQLGIRFGSTYNSLELGAVGFQIYPFDDGRAKK